MFSPLIESFFRCLVPPEVLAGVQGQGNYCLRDRDPERAWEQRLHIPYLHIHPYSRGERWEGVKIFDEQ